MIQLGGEKGGDHKFNFALSNGFRSIFWLKFLNLYFQYFFVAKQLGEIL